MKKLFTAIMVVLLYALTTNAQNINLSVYGTITDVSINQPVANHAVNIVVDSSFMVNFDICQSGGGCEAGFYAYPDSTNPYTITFIDNSTGFHDQWLWDFGDGQSSTQQNPVHSYNSIGTYLVCLSIWDSLGTCQDTYCDSIYVGGNPPGGCTNAFTYIADDSLTYTFTGEAYMNGVLANNNVDFFWNFGDGTTGFGQTPTHTFPQLNTLYEVCLTTFHFDSIPDTCVAISCQDVWVVGDTINNFTLTGAVFLQNQMLADIGEVHLMLFDTMGVNQVIIQSTTIDSGMYMFTDVASGAYYIQAELSPNSAYFGQYMPTYHLSALYWQNANLVVPMPVAVYDIYMLSDSTYAGGNGGVYGVVEEESFRELLEGVEMLLLGPNNEPYTYIRTDENGDYSFADLAYGTYKIYTEIPGIETIPVIVTLEEGNPTQEVNILIKDGMAVTIQENQNSKIIEELGNIYPNPVIDNARMKISLMEKTRIEINIMNLVGQTILHEVMILSAGTQQIQLNTAGIPSGLYHLQIITATGESISRKLIKY